MSQHDREVKKSWPAGRSEVKDGSLGFEGSGSGGFREPEQGIDLSWGQNETQEESGFLRGGDDLTFELYWRRGIGKWSRWTIKGLLQDVWLTGNCVNQ